MYYRKTVTATEKKEVALDKNRVRTACGQYPKSLSDILWAKSSRGY